MIAERGKPMVQVLSLETFPEHAHQRVGFLAQQIHVPDDFDEMGRTFIQRRFGGRL